MSRSLRSVVVVSGDPARAELLDAVLVDTHNYDVVFVDSFASGYSRIRQVAPDLIIVFLQIDDAAGCQLLSMLKTDGHTSRIPVVTCAVRSDDSESEDDLAKSDWDSPARVVAMSMN